jgi:hypothetical protein
MKRDARQTWRRVGAALPAVALIGGGAALTATGGEPQRAIVAEAKPVVTVPAAPLTRDAAPSLPALPAPPAEVAASLPATYGAGPLPASVSANGIPARALEAYRRGAALVAAADPECRIDWALVAAIGKVESDHGRYAGNGLDETGTVRPGIYGLPLNGNDHTAVVRDTDGGSLDRDQVWDRAVGPMQFIPGTWRAVGVDADGDGVRNPQNMADAATATAVYLCSGPGDLTRLSDLRSAVLRYNQSQAYADEVIAIADGYRRGVSVLADPALSGEQRTAAPYLPTGSPSAVPAASTAQPASVAGRPQQPAGGAAAGGSGAAPGGASGSGPSPTPTPSPTSSRGGVGAVTGVVGSVTKPLTGGSTPAPSPTPKPSTTTTAPAPPPEPVKPVVNLLGKAVCPSGYEFKVGLNPALCYPV